MSPWIKVCGLNSAAALAAAVEADVDAVGFVFHAGSPRNLTPAEARKLAAAVPKGILRVAVTRAPSRALVAAILAEFRPDALQTDVRDLAGLQLPAALELLPVLRSGEPLPERLPVRCLYESASSGSGSLADWNAARRLAATTEVVLAGGLSPRNVGGAIQAVRPYGVDVSSGVESGPGVKDPALIHAFVAAARAAASQPIEVRESQ